jgi:malate dehydrogenase (oxaloacetate-decarboxylating)(NADP+)
VSQGVPELQARRCCWFVDSRGLVVKSRHDLTEHKLPFAHEHPEVHAFIDAVQALKPTAIIGVSAKPGLFTREVLEAMAKINRRPIVFALSNPTSKAECTAREAYEWTGGRAIFASGSPFEPVTLDGHTYRPGQGNNAYIFPGVGLGVIAVGAKRVTDEMFAVAAETLAGMVSESDLQDGLIFPPLKRVREVSSKIAAAVARVAYARSLASVPEPANLDAFIRSHMYDPAYSNYA